MTEQLKEVLVSHKLWLETGGAEGGRADLIGADLREANLRGANLRVADLSGADLSVTTLCEANLRATTLCEANLRGANLRGANLREANLRGANLSAADLSGANLSAADLIGADLRDANLDYSCLPLSCRSLDVKVCKKIATQILYHFCKLDCNDTEVIAVQQLPQVVSLANQFHHVDTCGVLGVTKD